MLEEAANFGSERITKRRSLSVRTEMSLLVLPYSCHACPGPGQTMRSRARARTKVYTRAYIHVIIQVRTPKKCVYMYMYNYTCI